MSQSLDLRDRLIEPRPVSANSATGLSSTEQYVVDWQLESLGPDVARPSN